MQHPEYSLDQAFADLTAIKRAVERSAAVDKPGTAELGTALGADYFIQLCGFAVAGAFAAFELFTDHLGSRQVLLSAYLRELQQRGLIDTGLFLLLLVVLLYAGVASAAKRADRSTADFLARNFRYLKNLSFLYDLLIKYCVFALIIFASRPQWTAPLCTLFIADYLFQGRFFSFSGRASTILALLCFGLAIFQFAAESVLLIWPLALFALLCLGSALQLRLARRSLVSGVN